MVIYDGPSPFNKQPILGIATGFKGKSNNSKTGKMAQIFIIHKEQHPRAAIESKDDAAVCGNCPARGLWCYASLGPGGQGLGSVYKAAKRGSYPVGLDLARFEGEAVRFGAYGDPAMLPLSVISSIAAKARSFTGYTHQWKWCDQRFRDYFMASVDSEDEYAEATAAGWRTYRVLEAEEDFLSGEVLCPHYTTGIQCADCGHCDGKNRPTVKGNVAAIVHGSGQKHFVSFNEGE